VNGSSVSVLGLLRRYKSQIEVENLFRALKHPYFVHDVFLENDLRVLGLSYVLVIVLLIYALLQHRVRVMDESVYLSFYGCAIFGSIALKPFLSFHIISN
jgi:transposase